MVVVLVILGLIAIASVMLVIGLIWGVSTSYDEREDLEKASKIKKKRGKRCDR